jgi:hypothetical protein
MTQPGDTNGRSPSQTTTWRWGKIAQRPKGQEARRPQADRWYRLSRWNGRKPLTLRVTYRGGGECWYEITSRGATGRFVGSTYLHDVMDEIYGADRRSK